MFTRRGILLAAVTVAVIGIILGAKTAEAAQDSIQSSALAVFSIIIAIIAVGVAIYAQRRAESVRGDFQRFSRSVEMALNEVATKSHRDSATIGELNRMVANEIRGMTERNPPQSTQERQLAEADQVRPKPVRIDLPRSEMSDTSDNEGGLDLAGAIASGQFEISLQPIISVSQSAAMGFEVHAHIADDDGNNVLDVRRPTNLTSDAERAAFETLLLRKAIENGRRQLGSASEKMPLHIAISNALLNNSTEMENLAELTSHHRALAKSVVFSLEAEAFNGSGKARENLERLTMEKFQLSVENWDGDGDDAADAASRGVSSVKIAAGRLLDRILPYANSLSGQELIEAVTSAGIQIIATDVVRDEDAVNLIDLGIDFMEGERFSGPKLIKAPATRRAALAGT